MGAGGVSEISKLTPAHEEIIDLANEDYLTLKEAELAMLAFVSEEESRATATMRVTELINEGYIYVVELVEGLTGETNERGRPLAERRELRQVDTTEALDILASHESWQFWNTEGTPYYALSPTDKGREAFREIISRPTT